MAFSPAEEVLLLKTFTDEQLQNSLEFFEKELDRMANHKPKPIQSNSLKGRHERVLREMHRRKFSLCLIEIEVLDSFKEGPIDNVINWLNGIHLDDIEPVETDVDEASGAAGVSAPTTSRRSRRSKKSKNKKKAMSG